MHPYPPIPRRRMHLLAWLGRWDQRMQMVLSVKCTHLREQHVNQHLHSLIRQILKRSISNWSVLIYIFVIHRPFPSW